MVFDNPHLRELDDHLSQWLLRLRARDALSMAVRGLAAGLAAGLGLALIARLTPLQPVQTLILFAVMLALTGLLTALAIGFFWPRPRLAAARYFDRVFGLAERTSTALELAARPDLAPGWLRDQQWADAAASARGVQPERGLPLWTVPLRELLLTALVLAGLVASLVLPNPQQAVLAQRQAVQQAVAEQTQAIEDLIRRIEADPALTDEQKEALTQPLEEAQQRLREPDLSEEEALQALAEAQQEIRELQDPNAEAQAQSLQQAGEALSQNPATADAGEALANGDFQQAADELAGLDPSQLSEAERQALADQLDQAAGQLEAGNPATAEQLREAAEALRRGDAQAADEALDRAAQSIAEAGQQAAQSEAAGQASSQVARAQRAIGQAGQSGQGPQGQQGQQGQEGQGGAQGQGQQGQGQQGQGGGGAGRGEGEGQSQGGQAGGQMPQGNGPGDGGERVYEPIYAPYRVGGSGGPDVNLPEQGNGDPGDDVVGQGPTNPQDPGAVTVPYNEVFGGYRDSAYSAVDQGDYPPELRDVVKDYFSSLEP